MVAVTLDLPDKTVTEILSLLEEPLRVDSAAEMNEERAVLVIKTVETGLVLEPTNLTVLM
jgi:hypothetical protein